MTSPQSKIFRDSQHPIAGRILLLEDDELNGEWLGQSLSRKCLETHWFKSLQDAMAALESSATTNEKFHGIVTDVYMSDGERGGLDLLRKAEDFDIPCIVISSQADLEMAKASISHGATDFLEKPFDIQHLIKRFKKAWEEPRYLSALLEHFIEIHQMTDKEREVSRLLFKGLSNKEIAEVLGVTEKTVKFHVTGIFDKAGVKSRSEFLSTVFPT